MENLKIKERKIVHLKREASIGILSSILSVFIVLPYLRVNSRWTLSELYLELATTPLQILAYLLLAVLVGIIHFILVGIFYNVRDISPTNIKSILINQFIYGITILGFAYHYCSRPSKFNAAIYERFIEDKESFYVILIFILFYWILNVCYFNSKFFKS